MIYSYTGEILNHLITANSDVKGVPMENLRNLLSQFADDMTAFLKYDQISINAFGDTLWVVEEQMGLKVSYDKTVLYRVGSLHGSDASLYTARNFQWSNEPVDILGVKLGCDDTLITSNFTDVLEKLKKVCHAWCNRKLTLLGKILVVNTLMSSLFVFKMLTLNDMPNDVLQEANRLITEYIWEGKRPKISMATLKKKKEQGGLCLVDLEAKQKF